MRGRVTSSEEPDNDPNTWWVLMMGRVRPGASSLQVQSTLDLILKVGLEVAEGLAAARERGVRWGGSIFGLGVAAGTGC